MMRERNWAGNYVFDALRVHHPASVDDVQVLVARSRHIHAIGSRHSFNGIADSPGDLVDLAGIDPGFGIDAERRTVTCGAATTYASLARYLQAQGWALHNLASLPHISVAGAVATATHGSGTTSGNLSTAVAGLELVTASGDLLRVERGDPDFEGMVVALGALGIVTRITLDIEPTFDMRQDAFEAMPWTAALPNLDALLSAAYSVSLMTMWSGSTVSRLWFKTRLADGDLDRELVADLGATAAPAADAVGAEDVVLNPFGVPGPWCDRLPHFRLDGTPGPIEQIQSEYMVPRAQAGAAIERLRSIGDRIDPHLFQSEIRAVAADDLWLSLNYDRDSVGIHFTWKKQPEAVDAITREIEALLLPLDARPHWSKVMHTPADRLAPLYPKLPAFRDLARSMDPDGKFRNRFLNNHVFG